MARRRKSRKDVSLRKRQEKAADERKLEMQRAALREAKDLKVKAGEIHDRALSHGLRGIKFLEVRVMLEELISHLAEKGVVDRVALSSSIFRTLIQRVQLLIDEEEGKS